MNNALITNWNKTINDEDLVYILGDVSWYNPKQTFEILQQLKGKKILIKGNHDKFTDDLACRKQFIEIADYKEVKIDGQWVVLSHYPIMMWNWQHYNSIHLYGHVHNTQDYDLCNGQAIL